VIKPSPGLKIETSGTPLASAGDLRRDNTVANRWYEKAGLRRDALSSQVIDALKAQEIKETGSEED
jgi:hypothetical protein